MLPVSFRHSALTPPASSSITGTLWFIGDYRQVSVSIASVTNAASRYTFVASNADGLQSALDTPSMLVPQGSWSILTTITQQGMYTFDPAAGFRWIQCFSASSATITYAGRW